MIGVEWTYTKSMNLHGSMVCKRLQKVSKRPLCLRDKGQFCLERTLAKRENKNGTNDDKNVKYDHDVYNNSDINANYNYSTHKDDKIVD